MSSTAFQLSQMYSDLTGRRVSVMNGEERAASDSKTAIGVYAFADDGSQMLVKVDIAVLASLGGILVGLPESVIRQQAASSDPSEALLDAMHEVLNITAAAISQRRAVLQRMITDRSEGESVVREFGRQSFCRSRFHVSTTGYPAGELAVLAPIF